MLSDPARRGCFLVNTSIERAPHDAEVFKRVQTAYQDYEEMFYDMLIKAQATDELAWTSDPHQLARFLLGTVFAC